MKKGKYIDYTILLACLSKKPTPYQIVDGLLYPTTNPNDLLDTNLPRKLNKRTQQVRYSFAMPD